MAHASPSPTQTPSPEGHISSDIIREVDGVVAGNIYKSCVIDYNGLNPQNYAEDRNKIFQWLCPQQLFSALTTAAEGQGSQDAHENAGKSFIKSPKFEDWLAGKERKLWGTGPPGAGKTFLVSRVQKNLNDRAMFKGSESNARLAILYMHYNEKYTARDFLGCILSQFIKASRRVHPSIEKLWSDKGEHSSLDVEQLATLIRGLAEDDEKLYVVVDAWDECAVQARGQFLRALVSLEEQISVFITSRLTADGENSLSGFCRINISASETEIRDYISHCIANNPRLKDFARMDQSLEHDIKRKLIQESGSNDAGRIFLLVRLHMDSLKTGLLLDDVRKQLTTLHHDLNDKYQGIIERIDNQDPAHQRIAVDALTWITHACRPLLDKELQHALAVSLEAPGFNPARKPRVDDIVASCCGMVVLETFSKTFRLVHNTAKKFMRDLSKAEPRFRDPHSKISLVSCRYLCMPQLEQPDDLLQQTSLATDLWDDPIQYNESDAYEIQREEYANFRSTSKKQHRNPFSFSTKLNLFPLAEYAAVNLGHHLREMQDLDSEFAREALKNTHTILSDRPKRKFYERLLFQANCYLPHTFEYTHHSSHRSMDGMSHEDDDAFSDCSDASESSCQTQGACPEEGPREITSLHLAAQIGMPRLVTGMLGDGSLLQVRDYYGFNPLGIALCCGHSSIVLPLLKAGSNLNLQSSEGCRLLSFAAQSRSRCAEEVVHHILDHHLRIPDDGRHPVLQHFIWFCILAFTKIRFHSWRLLQLWRSLGLWLMRLRARLRAKAQPRDTRLPDLSTSRGVNFSQKAIESQDLERISSPKLLARTYSEAILPPERRQERDYLKLVVAALQGDCPKVRSLIADGKVILNPQQDLDDPKSHALIVNLALFLAIERNKTAVVETLIEGGVPIDSRDFDERTPLHRAAAKNNLNLVTFLIDRNAKVDAKDFREDTPWVIAAREGYDEICRLLVGSGADVNTTGRYGVSLLYGAAAGGHHTTVELLLQQGVNPSLTTVFGWSPLHWAAGNGHMRCVKLLLEAGAEVNVLSDTQTSPLDLAMQGGMTEIADLLRDQGAKTGDDLYIDRGGRHYDSFDPEVSSDETDETDSDDGSVNEEVTMQIDSKGED